MTIIYFIRHAQSDYSIHDDLTRPLSEKGSNDCALVTEFLQDKKIDIILSSPYKRAVDTISGFAKNMGMPIQTVDDFRERRIDSIWIQDFKAFSENQWADFSYKLSDGECLAEVQARNITALNKVLTQYKDKNIVIGTHGTALSTIINYYDPAYGYKDFMAMIDIMPWIVKMVFNENDCIGIEKIDLFTIPQKSDYEQCNVYMAGLDTLKDYQFVVIFARYQNKWLYCRAKEREVFETAGGHIEQGETPLEAAKREFYEETGAISFDIIPAFDYSVMHNHTEHSNGQVYFAQVNELGNIPDYEMEEVKLFDVIPDKVRFPKILPVLYENMQTWLNLQSPLLTNAYKTLDISAK